MSDRPLGLGVLGYGHFIRTNFIKHLRNCASINIVGVCNRGEERRQQAEDDGYWATSDLDEMLARDDVEAVLIGTANAAHHDQALACAAAGKHILCEKPMALTVAEARSMVEAAEKAGVLTHVNHGAPYTAAFEKFQSLAAEHCGQIMQVWVRNSRQFGTWKQGARHFAVGNPEVSGGWTFHHYCHFLNEACVLIDITKSPATRVYHINQKSCDEAPSEELCSSLITFANGATAQISDGSTIGGFGDLGIIGTDGDIRLLGSEIRLITHGKPDPNQRPGNLGQVIQTFEMPGRDKMLQKVGDIFAHAVRSGDPSRLIDFRWVLHEYQILEALKKSAQTGEVVDVE